MVDDARVAVVNTLKVDPGAKVHHIRLEDLGLWVLQRTEVDRDKRRWVVVTWQI